MPPNGRRQVAHEERVDPHDAAAHGPADPLGALLRRRVDDRRQPVRRRVGQLDRLRLGRRTSAASAPARTPRAGRPRCRWTPARSASARRAATRRPAAPPRTMRSPCARARSMNPSTRATWSGWIIGAIVVAGSRLSPSTWRSTRGVEAGRGTRRGPTPRRAAACRRGRPGRSRRTARPPWPRRRRGRRRRTRSSGPLPPSSAVNGTMFSAAARPMRRAVSGEPVKLIRLTRGSPTSGGPTSSPMPCTRLNTPGGKPASTVRSASSEHDSGDHSAGLRMTVLPAASAGATFHVDSMNGAFHGVMTTAGPAGIRTTVLAVPFDDHSPLLVAARRGRRRCGS